MAHIPKINFTGSALATTVQTIINTRDQKKTKVTSGIIHYSWCKNMADVAKHLLDNDPAFAEIDERLVRYFNFEAYGQYLDDNGKFIETEHGIYELP